MTPHQQVPDRKFPWSLHVLIIIASICLLAFVFAKVWTTWGAATGNSGTPTPSGLSAFEEKVFRVFQEQREAHNAELVFISMIITALGLGVVYLTYRDQVADSKREQTTKAREDSLQAQVESMMREVKGLIESMKHMIEASTLGSAQANDLIGSMKNMIDIAASSQKSADEVKNDLLRIKDELVTEHKRLRQVFEEDQKEKAEKEQKKFGALRELENKLRKFLERNNRFKMRIPELTEIQERINRTVANYSIPEDKLPVEADVVQGYFRTLVGSNNTHGIESFTTALSKTPDTEVAEAARFNRGINFVNLMRYKEAVDDFKELEGTYRFNVLYKYYRLDTELLHLRDDIRQGAGQNVQQANEFDRIEGELRALRSTTEQAPFSSDPMDQRLLRVRICRSLASLLIMRGKYDAAAEVLNDSLLAQDSSSLYLRLYVEKKRSPEVKLDLEAVSNCLQKAETEFKNSQEVRSKLLRGMITAQCYAWLNQKSLLEARKEDLRHLAIKEQQTQGTSSTVFSALSQRNVQIGELINEIDSLSLDSGT